MNHKALEAAYCAYYDSAGPSWQVGVDAAVLAYLEALTDEPDEQGYETCECGFNALVPNLVHTKMMHAHALLADFEDDE